MNYYKAPDNTLHALSAEDIHKGGELLLPFGCVQITEEQYVTLSNENAPKPTSESVRLYRERLLALCDWTQLADVPEATKTLWQPYRQALRDVPEQPGFPLSVEWPSAPQN